MFSSIQARNVQEAYVLGTRLVLSEGVREETRNGPALVVPHPVMTVYERPMERVLLDPVRDANPFFHLMESIWMLAGRNDVASIGRFLGTLKKYSDDGEIYHGAYGHRWRAHFDRSDPTLRMGPLDQLARIVDLLRANPGDRRIVLGMWDPTWDLGRQGADFPCNTQIYFRTRQHSETLGIVTPDPASGLGRGTLSAVTTYLDMTICNRSNDAVWGAYGANAVHMSVLQEFVAAACGFSMGHMYQLSNNLHGYMDTLDRVGEPCWPVTWAKGGSQYKYARSVPLAEYIDRQQDEYAARETRATPLFLPSSETPVAELLRQVGAFWDGSDSVGRPGDLRTLFTDIGLSTLIMMREAHRAHKNKESRRALSLAQEIPGADWSRACVEWLERRYATRDA